MLIGGMAAAAAAAPAKLLAPAPPMGWNSWDSYGFTISEADYRANANVLSSLK
jgi:alpha-galactosidase